MDLMGLKEKWEKMKEPNYMKTIPELKEKKKKSIIFSLLFYVIGFMFFIIAFYTYYQILLSIIETDGAISNLHLITVVILIGIANFLFMWAFKYNIFFLDYLRDAQQLDLMIYLKMQFEKENKDYEKIP